MKEHRIVGIFVATIALLCIAGVATAATSSQTGNWSASSTYTDGSPLAVADITGHEIDCQYTPVGGVAAACSFTPTSTTGSGTSFAVTVTYPSNTAGKACFRVRTKTASAVSAYGPLIAGSCRDLPALAPSAPGAVTITVTLALTLNSDSPITVAMSDPVVTKR